MTDVHHHRAEVAHREWRLSIGGAARLGAGPAGPVREPATDAVLTQVHTATVGDVHDAVERAASAFDAWRGTAPRARAKIVRSLADLLEGHAEELAWLDTLDAGLPLWMTRIDVATGIERMRLFADWAMELKGETIPATADHLHMTFPEPFGVVARIIPFNHPFMFAASKLAAPLVAGNSVVLKPSDRTPLSALRLGELAADVLPRGLLSVVHGGAEVGDALVRRREVRRIAFTGSEVVGRAIQRAGAEVGVKHVSLELGGKNAMLVFPDADLEGAVAAAVKGMNFAFAGQSCGSTSRVLVHRSVADEFTRQYVTAVESLGMGLPWEKGSQVSPLISRSQQQSVLRYIDVACADGAKVLTGGAAVAELAPGYYVQPTVLAGVAPGSAVEQEEIFGPVVSLLVFDGEREAVDVANGVDYGLTASVWTKDLSRAHRVARSMQAGYVWVNDTSTHFLGVPFGGVKASGIGREESLEELLSYTETKVVNVVLS